MLFYECDSLILTADLDRRIQALKTNATRKRLAYRGDMQSEMIL